MPPAQHCAGEGRAHDRRSHSRARFGKAQLPGLRDCCGRSGSIQPHGLAREARDGSSRAATLHCCDGGVRNEPLLGTVRAKTRPRGSVDSADLGEAVRQTAEERCGRRGCDCRSRPSAELALCGGQECRASSPGSRIPDPEVLCRAAHPADQRHVGTSWRVRAGRRAKADRPKDRRRHDRRRCDRTS